MTNVLAPLPAPDHHAELQRPHSKSPKDGLATYEKVVGRNYMAHREVYSLLHELLVSEVPDTWRAFQRDDPSVLESCDRNEIRVFRYPLNGGRSPTAWRPSEPA